jgi:hypothetical protein
LHPFKTCNPMKIPASPLSPLDHRSFLPQFLNLFIFLSKEQLSLAFAKLPKTVWAK